MKLASTRLRKVAEMAIKGGKAAGFAVDLLLGVRESRPNTDHQQAQRDSIKRRDCAEVEAHNVIVRLLGMMEQKHPSPGYDHPRHPEAGED